MKKTLGKKLVWAILLMCITLCATALTASYIAYGDRIDAHYISTGQNLVATLASQITPEALDHYFATEQLDDNYYKIQRFILDLAENNDVQYLYIVRPHDAGVTFLFDSDLSATLGYEDGGHCALGTYIDLEGAFVANIPAFQKGEPVEPVLQRDGSYGWMLTASYPVLHSDGTMAGYVMADISMTEVVKDKQTFLLYMIALMALLTMGFSAVYLHYIRRIVVEPVQQLAKAVRAYEGGGNKQAFAGVNIKTNDEFRTLSDAFQGMLSEVENRSKEQANIAAQEERLTSERQLAAEVNASMLPKPLPDLPSRAAFEVQGYVERSKEMSCDFFDYFYIDPGLLCVLIGETPGRDIPSALFMVVAQTTVRSQLRLGLSLAEAMTAANRQLFEMGGALSLRILVGTLSVGDGIFSYINAGQQPPLLLVDQEQYEWVKSQPYAPLGMNENISYLVESVRLKQSDRLFLYTGGLAAMTDGDGKRFDESRLRMALNITRSKSLDVGELLHTIANEATVFSGKPLPQLGYSVLALEYKQGNRAIVRWAGLAISERVREITSLLKSQFEENGISKREYARVAVMADELFSFCCRRLTAEQQITLECSVAPDAQLITIRILADLGGKDPFDAILAEAEQNAVTFIQQNADYIGFKSLDGQDKITLVISIEMTNAF